MHIRYIISLNSICSCSSVQYSSVNYPIENKLFAWLPRGPGIFINIPCFFVKHCFRRLNKLLASSTYAMLAHGAQVIVLKLTLFGAISFTCWQLPLPPI